METIKLVDIKDVELVKEIQYLLGIEVDGIVGPQTLGNFRRFKENNWLNNIDTIGQASLDLLRKDSRHYDLSIIKEYEGFKSKAYADPLLGWQLPTIGYGTTVYSDRRRVARGDTISEKEAYNELIFHVNNRIVPRLSHIPYWREMNVNQKSALISFAYNLGEGFYGNKGFNTITNALKNKEWSRIPKILELYRNPGSNVELGLLRRRRAEGRLWSTSQS